MSLHAELQTALDGRVETDADLAGRTSVRVGGKAALFAQPASEQGLARALEACVQHGSTYRVLGGGANTIVADAGVKDVVFKLAPELVAEEWGEDEKGVWVKLSAGQPIARLVQLAKAKGLVGMEFMAGIPGTIGGAVWMNAGTKTGWTGSIVEELGVCDRGSFRTLKREDVGFEYRHTALPATAVVTWAKFRLQKGDAAASKKAMEDDLATRKRTQPLTQPNFGSVFRNPPGDYSARLIEAAGLKGTRLGDAQISEKHANFIVNLGHAKARDVLGLMRRMQDAVLEKFEVSLIPEVKLLGDFEGEVLPRGV